MGNGYDSGFTPRTYSAPDGLKLYARDYGYDDVRTQGRAPLVCLPGLSRNSRDFHQLAVLLSTDPETPRRVVTLDYRGRGLSEWDKDKSRYALLVEADDVIAACAALDIPPAAFIGTSRGGLTLHFLAAIRPTMLKAVILNDIGPVVEGAGLAQIKAYLGRERKPAHWAEAATILQETHGRSFTALSDQDWIDMAHAIYAEVDGKLVADFDPAIAEQMKNIDLNAPIPALWTQFEGLTAIPLMAIRGENSALFSAETLELMKKRYPAMTAMSVAGQGHAPIVHLSGIPLAIKTFLAGL